MNYKTRLTFLFVGLFLIVLTSILTFIYISYADFRRDDFIERLRQKSFTTAILLADIKEVDKDLLKLIDQNSINKMYDEKILVFNGENELIYSSLDDEIIPYSTSLIEEIRKNGETSYVDADDDEVVGVHYASQDQDYVILASAYDTYGITKLKKLMRLLIGALLMGTLLIAISGHFYIRQVFRPIDDLNKSIQHINENNLRDFIAVSNYKKDALDKLAVNYNKMLSRLYKAFESQRTFVRSASHELKTPLARILGKIENLFEIAGKDNQQIAPILDELMGDVKAQASLAESLLLIQRLESQVPINMHPVRIDELLFDSASEINADFPELRIEVDIKSIKSEELLMVNANEMLLKICFRNLIGNAALYSDSGYLRIVLSGRQDFLQILFINTGAEKLPKDIIFEPFYRQTGQGKPGNGLGLSIVKQIVQSMAGEVQYYFERQRHHFRLILPHYRF